MKGLHASLPDTKQSCKKSPLRTRFGRRRNLDNLYASSSYAVPIPGSTGKTSMAIFAHRLLIPVVDPALNHAQVYRTLDTPPPVISCHLCLPRISCAPHRVYRFEKSAPKCSLLKPRLLRPGAVALNPSMPIPGYVGSFGNAPPPAV